MTIEANKNDRFQTNRLASPYNIMANLSEYLTELSKSTLRNMLINENMRHYNDGSTLPRDWSKTGSVSLIYNDATKSADGSFGPSGKITQAITSNLRPNRNYTAIVICETTNGDYKASITATSPDQIYDLIDAQQVNVASSTSVATSGLQKLIIQFKTNATAVSGSIYFNIENLNLAISRPIKVRYTAVFDALVEFEEVAPNDVYYATHSTLASSATSANLAVEAFHSDTSSLATWAISASVAQYAQNANTATYAQTSSYAASAGVAAYADTSGDAASHYGVKYVIDFGGANNIRTISPTSLSFVINDVTYYVPATTVSGFYDPVYNNTDSKTVPFVGICHSNCVCHSHCDGNWGRT